MKLSILIVNWNSKDYLRECLRTIQETCAHLAPQVVVVDGGSFDGSAEMLAADFPEVDFVQSPDNIGFGRSNNLGFSKVEGDVLLLLNPDTELKPGAVDELLAALESQPEAGLVGARLFNSDGSLQFASVHLLPTPWNVAVDSNWMRRRWWRKHGPREDAEPGEVEAVSGACMMLRSSTYESLRGFDPRYFMYAEDMDLCARVRRLGHKIYHVPKARVIHHGGGSSQTRFSKFSTVMIREAVWVFLLEHRGRLQARWSSVLMALSALVRILLLGLLWIVGTPARKSTALQSIRKWWVVLRWCLGLETWSREHFVAPAQEIWNPAGRDPQQQASS